MPASFDECATATAAQSKWPPVLARRYTVNTEQVQEAEQDSQKPGISSIAQYFAKGNASPVCGAACQNSVCRCALMLGMQRPRTLAMHQTPFSCTSLPHRVQALEAREAHHAELESGTAHFPRGPISPGVSLCSMICGLYAGFAGS